MKKILNALEVITFLMFVLIGCSLDSLSLDNVVIWMLGLLVMCAVCILLEAGVSDEREGF